MDQQHQGNGNNIIAGRDVVMAIEPKHISLLSSIVNTLGKKLYIEEEDEEDKKESFNIDAKIEYNHVKGYRMIIDENKIYIGKLSAIYKEYDAAGTNKTQMTLSNVRRHYLQARMHILAEHKNEDEIVVIRRHADDLIKDVESRLLSEVQRSSNIEETVECINVSLQIVIIDALMRCKILEKPQ